MGGKTTRPAPRKGSRWLVTGGAGFLGHSIFRRLRSAGAQCRSLDVADPEPAFRVDGVEYVKGDVRDLSAVRAAVRGIDYVVHAAAALPIHRSGRFIRDVNVNGMRNVLEASVGG